MSQTIQKPLRDSAAMRWTALLLLALAMFCSYIFMDILSPIFKEVQDTRGWDGTAFGTMQGSEVFLNVFVFFLIFAGIILDKMGVRFTAVLSGGVMLVGAIIKWYAMTDGFIGSSLDTWFTENLNYIPIFDELGVSPFYAGMPSSAKLAACGFMIFGCGCEMAGTTVSKAIAKWFKGKEMAMAMGIEMAIARVGVFAIFSISPFIANKLGSVAAPVGFCTVLLLIGLINFIIFTFMDSKFDKELVAAGIKSEDSSEDEFQVKDLKQILTSLNFWVVAILCVLYYSAIFPFQRYGANMLQCNLNGLSAETAANIFRWFPIGAAVLTPFLGRYLDTKGKGATMLIWGAVLLIVCHLVFAFALPATGSRFLAYATIVVLGVSFSLVPAALWPSVPKIIDEKVLGSAYCLIFWVQNIGLCFVPLLIGSVLDSSNANNPDVIAAKAAGAEFIPYNYTVPLIIFACFGIAALVIALYLKALDSKRHLGLEEPNIKPASDER